jgi:hypothetical protein
LNYIHVLGPIRAGKTLVGRALNMHPTVSLQQEPYFFFFKICRNIYFRDIIKVKHDPEKPLGLESINSIEYSDKFSSSFSNLYFNKADINKLIEQTTWQQTIAGSERAPKILAYLNILKPNTAKNVFIQLMKILTEAYKNKSLTHVGYTEAWCDNYAVILNKIFKKKHYCINSLRDPRAVIASRNHGSNIQEKYGGKYPILVLIRHWRNNVINSIINDSNDHYLTVKYEDIVSYPDFWFSKICFFLGINFSNEMLDVNNFINGQGEIWKQNTSFKSGTGFSTKSVDKWKSVLPDDEINLIEYLCRPEMEYLNYELSSDELVPDRLKNYFEDTNLIMPWLQPYNLHFSENRLSKETERVEYFYNTKNADNNKVKNYYYNEIVLNRLKSSRWECPLI